MASRQRDFYSKVYNDARAAGLSDPQARVAAAQASLETGFGRSAVGNNYFGIKAGSSWTGPSVNAGTWENVNGQNVNTNANFRSYENPQDSLNDWSSTVSRNFPDSYWADDFDTAVSGLNNGKYGSYATDPNYGSKLRSIDRRYGPELGIMSVIDPPTPTPREVGLLGDVHNANYQLGAVTSAPLGDPSLASFDMGRFGPAPPSTAAFDAVRFGNAVPTKTNLNDLRRGLLDQQLDAGILPSLSQPAYTQMAAAPAPQPGYVDPMVTTSTQPNAPTVQAPASVAPATGFVSPEQQAIADAGGILSTTPNMDLGRQVEKELSNRRMAGGILGGLLGGLALGPVGALGGGLLGRSVANRSYHPPAPKAPAGAQRGGGTGYNSLSDYGRDAYSRSDQFHDAVDSGKGGLW